MPERATKLFENLLGTRRVLTFEVVRAIAKESGRFDLRPLRRAVEKLEILSEPSLRDRYLRIDEPDLELAAQLDALHDLPDGTLGHAFVEFHTRNGLMTPGADIHTPAHYVSHDMNHVIAGYEPTGPGEIALGAFTLAMCDNDANWIQFIANLAIHEAGLVQHGDIMPKAATMSSRKSMSRRVSDCARRRHVPENCFGCRMASMPPLGKRRS